MPDSSRKSIYLLSIVLLCATMGYIFYENGKREMHLVNNSRTPAARDFSVLCDSCGIDPSPLADKGVVSADESVVRHDYKHRIVLSTNNRSSCLNVNFSTSKNLPPTALASYPGSGNTWTRHLVELLTGHYSGAIYMDPTLVKEFPGEGKRSRDCIVVKTHWPWYKGDIDDLPYERAVLIIREPLAAIKAEFNRHFTAGSHTQQLKNVDPKVWHGYLEKELLKNLQFHTFWFTLAQQRSLDMFILFYEDLKLAPRKALSNVGHFLGALDYAQHLDCVLQHSEGAFHRDGTKLDPLQGMETFPLRVAGLKFFLNELIERCILSGRCVTSGKKHY